MELARFFGVFSWRLCVCVLPTLATYSTALEQGSENDDGLFFAGGQALKLKGPVR